MIIHHRQLRTARLLASAANVPSPPAPLAIPVPQVEQIGSPTVVVIPPTDESIQPIAGDDELRMVFSILCS